MIRQAANAEAVSQAKAGRGPKQRRGNQAAKQPAGMANSETATGQKATQSPGASHERLNLFGVRQSRRMGDDQVAGRTLGKRGCLNLAGVGEVVRMRRRGGQRGG